MVAFSLAGVVLDERYRIIAPLAEGAMGSVVRAERIGLGREVAIKLMHAVLPGALAGRERFEREARLMAKLEHPHCVSVIDFGLVEDKPYLVMELVRGHSLHQVITSAGRLPPRRAADIARQILAGLAHAHELGIVHRDIKPANIMVSPKEALGDHVQILDFGLARLLESSSLLTTGVAVGTPSYMAPEQCRGAPADLRVDLYACGIVLFEMLTGGKPFNAKDPLEIVKLQLTQPPPRLSDVLPGEHALEGVVARALAKDPAERYASAVEMANAIEAAVPTRASSQPVQPVSPAPAADIPLLGSSVIEAVEDVPPPRATSAPPPPPGTPRAPSIPPVPPPSEAVPLDPHEASMLRRMLPASRMKWAALFFLLLAAGGIYGIIYLKHYLAHGVH